ncbi:UDP-N-acetylmuramoyl-L-alanyl-D-glutamate--2,6-diaminopimelate ligase [uncultured Aquimonas sp.]|mgnify:FL=1|uniref:UDP-N-acetylmuramoyl-L-alanyl-D-glutamate--2, 6-diaminopimelate ligase n=1 Tax=uncultured Aquimonas sp. TaxID=385483 RepID=UPI00086C3ADE|nr:UDP-N-acetylmuramoyl-L-alanyl-D-glutamate--2,6-diaminopimelate ligase [uncultured Aquimonas sp.]ODU44677.1 MAG: UDP-N-acetylmuramoyl-L-alanyl-D-glutamate--2,6-diaminopimelate ligase [Xanthomonadaceae bacterium SCN 69-123]
MSPRLPPLSLQELLPECSDLPELSLSGLRLDSRAVEPGEGFVALAGARTHGLLHAAEAVRRGAVVVLSEPFEGAAPLLPVPLLVVPGLRERLPQLAQALYAAPTLGLELVGVTGTNGKTSTVQLSAQALQLLGRVAGSIGTLGAGLHGQLVAHERTTPDVLEVHRLLATLSLAGAQVVAMEVSSHALDQGRVAGLQFDVAVFTNLSRDHLDYHGTMAAYAAAKASLFAWDSLRAAVINLDDTQGALIAAGLPERVDLIGFSALGAGNAVLRAGDVALDAAGLHFHLQYGVESVRIDSPLLGRFNVDNLLAVAGVLLALGVDFARVAALLPRLEPIPGRMNRLGGSAAQPLVVVDYAHTPDGLEQALSSLRQHTAGRLLCVFGCGGDRDRGKRPQMAAIAGRLADQVIVTDDNPRSEDGEAIVADILAGFAPGAAVEVERDRAAAIRAAIRAAGPADTVLVAGKGHETYQETGERRLPFDDLAVAALALRGSA